MNATVLCKFVVRPALAGLVLLLTTAVVSAAEPPMVRSQKSGPWSAKETWDGGRLPQTGDRVLIRADHQIVYDVDSKEVIRLVRVAGTLTFARDRDTRLEVGLLKIAPGEDLSEDGFNCHDTPEPPAPGKPRPTLLVGTPDQPIPAGHRALIRLHYIKGMDEQSCPAIVCCAGRMDFHGAPLPRTWVKLQRTATSGTTSLALSEAVEGWKEGDLVIVTGTHRQQFGRAPSILEKAETEERTITGVGGRNTRESSLKLDKALQFEHFAEDNYRAEVANLSRNVIVESADPAGVRGHTMYHLHSTGAVSYAEFRHLGKRDTLGRYSLHFHLAGDTMRGSFVIGASIWDSANHWLTIHGTNYLVVRDCVGYKSVGHGFFMEDATEVYNVLDHNLAVMALAGKPLPKQMLPFDENKGAGFWWANCLNTFTNNVAAECDEYGYRFDNKKTKDFDPVMSIMQADGSLKKQDTRVLPFVKFENNEAHTMRFFGLNLRGLTRPAEGLDFYALNETLSKEATQAHPDQRYPFWIHNFRCWDTNWSFHAGTTGVFLDGFDVYRAEYGIWRSVIDRHTYHNLTMKEIRNKDLHMPFSVGVPQREDVDEKEYFRGIPNFVDDQPPTTVITHAQRDGNLIRVRGTTSDSSAIKRVLVNGRPARSTRGSFAEWEITLEAPADKPCTLTATAEDSHGYVEARPHKMELER